MAPGARVSPWVDREAEANAVLADLGLDGEARTFAGTVGALGDVEGLVAEAWDLDGIRTEYERFIVRHQRTRPGTDQDAFVATTQLVHDWRRFPFLEPDLPAELLPRRWSGQRAADLFHRQHGRWSPGAGTGGGNGPPPAKADRSRLGFSSLRGDAHGPDAALHGAVSEMTCLERRR